MAPKNYDPDQVSVIVGTAPIEGFSEDSIVKIKYKTPRFSSKAGVTGEIVLSKAMDERAEIEISLMQTSNSNDILSAIVLAAGAAPNGAGVFPITIRDKSGRAKYFGANAWITMQPDAEFGASPKERVWKIEVAQLVSFTGGS